LVVAFVSKGRKPASMHLPDLAAIPDLARTEPLTVMDSSGQVG
jgi:hypothetical protein